MSGFVVPPGGGRSFGPGINVKVEHGASPSFAVFESVVPPLWPGPGPHLHRTYDEAVYILDGNLVFTLDGVEHACRPGPLSLSRGAAATGSRIRRPIPPGSCPWRRRVRSAWSKNSSVWSEPDKAEFKQASTMRQSIPRRRRPCMRGTTASWSRAKGPY